MYSDMMEFPDGLDVLTICFRKYKGQTASPTFDKNVPETSLVFFCISYNPKTPGAIHIFICVRDLCLWVCLRHHSVHSYDLS